MMGVSFTINVWNLEEKVILFEERFMFVKVKNVLHYPMVFFKTITVIQSNPV